jgi:putative membrane protein
MPLIVLLHVLFISAWVGTLVLLCILCAERTATGEIEDERLNLLTLRLFALVTTLSGVLAVLTGTWLAYARGFDGGWLPAKLGFVVLLSALHVYIGRLIAQLRDRLLRRRSYYLFVSSGPVLVSLPILFLVLGKPF